MPSVKPITKKAVSSKKAEKTEAKQPASLELPVFNQEGKEVEKIRLPGQIFALKINPDLINQVYEAQMSQSRIHYAQTKDRSEVRGGGKKPWRQKGTGRARHGSIRSPLWKGGGVTFGPRNEKVFAKDINRKMRRAALLMVLSGKVRDNELIVLDDLKLEQPKTKLMASIVKSFKLKVKSDINEGGIIIMPQKDENVIRATRNIPKFATIGAQSLNVADLLSYKYLLMMKGAIEVVAKTYLK